MFDKLTLKNFQAWPSLELPLSEVTVIVGETNGGKSSILRALTCVLYNALEGTGMVRKGTSQSEVTLEGEGMTVRWLRGEKVNRYELNGQVFDKVGRTVPDPVVAAIGIKPLEYDGETVRLQWAPQMGGPFLIGDSGAKATRMLGSAGQAALAALAAKLAAGEVKKQNDLADATRSLLTDTQAKLDALAWVDAAAPMVAAVEAAQAAMQVLGVRQEAILAALSRRDDASYRLRASHQLLTTAESRRTVIAASVERLRTYEVLQAFRTAQSECGKATFRADMATVARDHMGTIVRCVERQEAVARLQQAVAVQQESAAKVAVATAQVQSCRAVYEQVLAEVTCAACGQIKEAA